MQWARQVEGLVWINLVCNYMLWSPLSPLQCDQHNQNRVIFQPSIPFKNHIRHSSFLIQVRQAITDESNMWKGLEENQDLKLTLGIFPLFWNWWIPWLWFISVSHHSSAIPTIDLMIFLLDGIILENMIIKHTKHWPPPVLFILPWATTELWYHSESRFFLNTF